MRYTFSAAASSTVLGYASTSAEPALLATPIALGRATSSSLSLTVAARTAAVLLAAITGATEKKQLPAAGRHALHDPQ